MNFPRQHHRQKITCGAIYDFIVLTAPLFCRRLVHYFSAVESGPFVVPGVRAPHCVKFESSGPHFQMRSAPSSSVAVASPNLVFVAPSARATKSSKRRCRNKRLLSRIRLDARNKFVHPPCGVFSSLARVPPKIGFRRHVRQTNAHRAANQACATTLWCRSSAMISACLATIVAVKTRSSSVILSSRSNSIGVVRAERDCITAWNATKVL